jgi:hypothetical protein
MRKMLQILIAGIVIGTSGLAAPSQAIPAVREHGQQEPARHRRQVRYREDLIRGHHITFRS